jgi:phenylacetic acid degradation operon negative regulatory protein
VTAIRNTSSGTGDTRVVDPVVVAAVAAVSGGRPPRALSARSVVASTLLGAVPPELPVRTIVRCGALFGIGPGAVRTAVSRMLADGSLTTDPQRPVYRVGGTLAARHARQSEGRSPVLLAWDATWTQVVVNPGARSADQRAALRTAARQLRLAELREGVWLRPANLQPDRYRDADAVVASQCTVFRATPDTDPVRLAASLWDLDRWAAVTRVLVDAVVHHHRVLDAGDPGGLADGFVLSAAVLRHLVADPLLPDELVGDDWPGPGLREVYDAYDATYKLAWRDWFRSQALGS